jgi:thiamine biosynthesis lipoprotein
MATWFEVLLVGVDEEHLMAVGEAALDEVDRIERLLSRFDPASETSRINREAGSRPVLVDREMFAILRDCRDWSEKTGGYFDLCADSVPGAIELDEESRTVRLVDPSARLDFGGFGKGYALDAAWRILDEFGVDSALLHGGTSSILARGCPEDAPAWRVGLRDPFDAEREVMRIPLMDRCLSSSAALAPGSTVSDIFDPIYSGPLRRQAACSEVAPTAREAEVLSTALVAMGRRKAGEIVDRGAFPGCRAAWIEREGERVAVEWLTGEGGSA